MKTALNSKQRLLTKKPVMKRLTARQKQVMDLVIRGCRSQEIAVMLNVSVRTVENHRYLVLKRFGVKNALEFASLLGT